ncbi:MAG: phosphotransferase family protein [Acidimicrobiales bacterium]|nr:phosphotransferase family protein [Acidimicrobiales bacterium]
MAAFADADHDPLAGLLDLERVTAWLDSLHLGAGPITAERIEAGETNEMFVLTRGGERWVLRRPAGVALDRSEDNLRREYRLMSALDGSPVPHPRAVALCEDRDVLGCVFYVMGHVDGVMPANESYDTPEESAELGFALMDALAELHRADWRALGLEDFGRPDGFHERQVQRWMRQLESYGARELAGIHDVGRWLGAHLPTEWTPTIMHGDYHMLNVLVSRERPRRVLAIVDWETATIGDPYVDLAGYLRMYDERRNREPQAGWPDRGAMIERYDATRGVASPDLTYYSVLARFRLAVLLEGVYQRSLVDPTRTASEQMGAYVEDLVVGALAEIGD